MLINGIDPHFRLEIQKEKPRNTTLIDVMLLRKHTSFTASLDVLSTAFFGESPKALLSGENVSDYFHTGKLEEIKKYCESDVAFTARCYHAITSPGSQKKSDFNSLDKTSNDDISKKPS